MSRVTHAPSSMSHPHMELSSSTHQVRGVQRKQYHLRRVVRHRPNLCLSSLCLSPFEVIVSTGCWRATEHSRRASSLMHDVHTRCAKARFALQPLWASLPSFWSFITFASSPQRTCSRLQRTPDRYRLQALGRARRVFDRGRLRQPPPPVVGRLRAVERVAWECNAALGGYGYVVLNGSFCLEAG